MGATSRPAAYAATAALVLASVGAALPVGSARAEEACLSGPGAAAPAGQHWYYRYDRTTHRRCWFTHAIGSFSEHAAARSHAAASPEEPSAAAPGATHAASAPPADASNVPNASNIAGDAATQPQGHVTMLAVKPDPQLAGTVSPPGAPSVAPALALAPEPAAEPQMPRDAAGNVNRSAGKESRLASHAGPGAIPDAADAAPHEPAAAKNAATASASAADSFPVWALAFVIAAALIVLVGKMTGLLRLPRFLSPSDDAWRSGFYQRESPFLAPLDADGPTDLNLLQRINRSPPVQADPQAFRSASERLDKRNSVKRAAQDSTHDIEPERASSASRAETTAMLDRG